MNESLNAAFPRVGSMIKTYFANVLDIVTSTHFSDLEKNIYPLCELILQITPVRSLYIALYKVALDRM